MASSSGGIPGLGVALATAGGFLVFISIRNVGVLDGLRDIIRGQLPPPGPQRHTVVQWGRSVNGSSGDGGTSSSPGGTVTTAAGVGGLVASARSYIGIRYKFGGSQNPSVGFDCSGLVNWVANHDNHLPIPGMAPDTFTGASHGPVTTEWYTWSGLADVARANIRPGDLVCWTTHIGICSAVGGERGPLFIAAPSLGRTVLEEPIYWSPTPRIRRYPGVGTVSV